MSRIPTRIYPRLSRARARFPPLRRYSNYCLYFDGVNNRVDCGNPASLNFTTESIAVEAWIRFWSKANHMGLVEKGRALGTFLTTPYELSFHNGGGIIFNVADGAAVSQSVIPLGDVPLNEWMHVLGTYDQTDNRARIYWNTRLIDTGVALVGNILVVADTLEIGGDTNAGRYSQTWITEVRILNTLPTAEDRIDSFKRGYARREANSALNIRMEEGSGLTVSDDSGLGNNGNLLPAPTPPTWTEVMKHELLAEARA